MNATTSSDGSRLRGTEEASIGQPNEVFSLQDFAPRIAERSSAPDGMNKEALAPISVQGRFVERVQSLHQGRFLFRLSCSAR
jgi:hypothetical protein